MYVYKCAVVNSWEIKSYSKRDKNNLILNKEKIVSWA
jgi:hypothetical protein